MGIVERSLGTNDLLYGELLNDLALVLNDRNHDYAESEKLLRKALEIDETLLGPQSYKASIALQNLAMIARQRKNYDQAEEYNRRVLAIRERIIGPDHPDIAPILNNLALVYRDKGDVPKSLETHFQALRIWEQSAGPYNNGTMFSLGNIARTYAAIGDTARAIEFQRRVDAVLETQLELNLAIGSERQRRAFADSMSDRTDRTISLSLYQAPDQPDATALAALVLLQRKGRVLDAMTDTLAAVRRRAGDPAEQGLIDQLGATMAQLARVALSRPEDMAPTDHQRLIKELEEKREKLEAQINDRDAEFRARSQTVTVAAVQAAIPDGAAFLEFAVFRPFDPKASSNNTAYGKPHYAAYVIRRRTPPRGYDLGPAAGIDEAIDALRQALRDPGRKDVKALARAVDAKVLAPIRALAGDATRLVVSQPDPVRGARRRSRPLRDRALRDQLRDERQRSAAHAGRSRGPECADDRRRSAVRRAGAFRRGRAAGNHPEARRLRSPQRDDGAGLVDGVLRPLGGDGGRGARDQSAVSRCARAQWPERQQIRAAPPRGAADSAHRHARFLPRRSGWARCVGSASGSDPRHQRDDESRKPSPSIRPRADRRQPDEGRDRRRHPDRARSLQPESVGHQARDPLGLRHWRRGGAER
jgi:tetratricopeptide (TPR) repeat protein